MADLFLPRAATFAGEIDVVIWILTVIVGFWFFVTQGAFFWLLWKFRSSANAKAQYVTGKEKHLKRWITIPHYIIIACDIVIIVAGVRVWYMIKQDMPEPEAEIEVWGQQWAWGFVHPGADGKLGTDDDIKTVDELHVEVDKVHQFHLHSRDVIHSFSVPVFRLKQDVIPGRKISGWFEPTLTGTFDIQCAEICGIGHGIMGARIFVESPEDHAKWIAANSH
jgi:cytochrome c oxidase subunit 2